MSKDLQRFGQKLTELRTKTGLSRKALLERLDQMHATVAAGPLSISPQLLWNWEKAYTYKGRQWTPPRQHVLYLIEAFADHLTLDEALVWSGQAGYSFGKSELHPLFFRDGETQPKRSRLSWQQLRSICQDITRHRTATVRTKYHQALYLPRRPARRAFDEFLRSDKRGFVLIGKSGVGKSNFLLDLQGELYDADDQLCFLMYDAGHLQTGSSLTEVINRDVGYRLNLGGARPFEIWPEIAGMETLTNRRIILCVDAVNEHTQAAQLLAQLDQLVQSPWPWLRVLFSSRPETWRVIKSRTRLSEALYYRENDEFLGVTLEPFSYSQRLDDFSRQELPQVYAKYQAVFGLQTAYHTLPLPLKQILRDPLSLWLVARTYQDQSIPPQLKRAELISKYLEVLWKNNTIRRSDLQWLTTEIVPLLARNQVYRNALSLSDLQGMDGALYETILADQPTPGQQSKRQAFINLQDVEILIWQQEAGKEALTFKYERFYEYFVGRHLVELSQTQPDRPAFFSNLVTQTSQTPFLWGAIKQALLEETIRQGSETILHLCFTDQQPLTEMVIETLVELGFDDPDLVKAILEMIISPQKKVNRLQSLLNLFDKSYQISPPTRQAQRAAIKVAGQLQITSILETAVFQRDTAIRTAAIHALYRLWQNNPELGFITLERLASQAVAGFIPHLTAIESTFVLSLIILFDSPKDPFTLQKLRDIWRELISQMFGLQETYSRPRQWLREFGREQAFNIVARISLKLLDGLTGHAIVNSSDLEAFFKLERVHKTFYRRLPRYLDVHGDYSKAEMEQDFITALAFRNLLIEGVLLMCLAAHYLHDPVGLNPLLKKLLHIAETDPLPSPYLSGICDILWSTTINRPMSDETFSFFVETVELCQTYYSRHPKIPHLKRDHVYYGAKAMYLGAYVYFFYRKNGTIETVWLQSRIEAALLTADLKFFDFLLETELSILGIELRQPHLALDVIALFFDTDHPKIQQMIQTFLARLRAYYRNDVDDFLERQGVPLTYRLHIQTNEPGEDLSWLLGLRIWSFIEHELIAGSPLLRTTLIQIFESAAECENVRRWAISTFKQVVNLLFEKEVLRQTNNQS